MTTKSTKPVRRETSALVRDRGLRPLIVTVHHGLLLLRAKGLRREETLDLAGCYAIAIRQRLAREQAEKKAKRKAGINPVGLRK
jgi:hypothetical protein